MHRPAANTDIHVLTIADLLLDEETDQFGRPVDREGRAVIRAGIPAWHPRNDGDDDGDGDGDGDGSGDGDGDDDDGDGSGDGDGDDDGDDGDDDDAVRQVREAKAAQKAAEKRAATAERKLKQAERKKDQSSGEFKKMYEEEKARGDALETRLRDGELERATVAQAAKLKFHNPQKAYALVKADLGEAIDDDYDVDTDLVVRALKKLAREEPYMVDQKKNSREVDGDDVGGRRKKRRARDGDGDGDGDGYTFNPKGNLASAYAGSGAGADGD